MRLGVLDVGSNTVHLLVVDAHSGGHPTPTHSTKTALRLAEHLTDGRLEDAGADALVAATTDARRLDIGRRAARIVSGKDPRPEDGIVALAPTFLPGDTIR